MARGELDLFCKSYGHHLYNSPICDTIVYGNYWRKIDSVARDSRDHLWVLNVLDRSWSSKSQACSRKNLSRVVSVKGGGHEKVFQSCQCIRVTESSFWRRYSVWLDGSVSRRSADARLLRYALG